MAPGASTSARKGNRTSGARARRESWGPSSIGPSSRPTTHRDDRIEFGCGGGYLLHILRARSKVGVDVNPAARAQAARLGIETHATLAEPEQAEAPELRSEERRVGKGGKT